jgi:hypothetical protein
LSVATHEEEEIGVIFPIIGNGKYYRGAIVKVYSPITFYEKEYLFDEYFINDAEVFLNGMKMENIDTINTKFNYFYWDTLNFNPGDSIFLDIYLKNPEDTIRGISVIPDKMKNVKFSWEANYYYISWENFKNYSYDLLVYDLNGHLYMESYIGNQFQVAIDRGDLLEKFTNDSCYILIINYDSNFTKYRVEGEERAGIDKHYGVFTGAYVNYFLLDMKNNKLEQYDIQSSQKVLF